MANKNLSSAKVNKNDEFYTRLEDISIEVVNYKELIKDKIIYLNTDNPEFSQFFNYFNLSFDFLQLKQVIATFYNPEGNVYRTDIIRENGEKIIKKTELKGDGDFRSQECKDILQECDIVITNPPFSLFRDLINLLELYDKKYLLIGNMNAISYKEIFPLIRDDKLWLGINNGSKSYVVPENYKHLKTFVEDGKVMTKLGNTCWFTNLDYKKRHETFLSLIYNYYEDKSNYFCYDNYDGINVDDVYKIPDNYWGVIGVPISFLNKLNPDQFDILGLGINTLFFTPTRFYEGCKFYKKNGDVVVGSFNNQLMISCDKNKIPVILGKSTYYTADNVEGYLITPYARLLIKRKDLQKIDSVEELKEKLKYLYDRPGGFYTLSFKTDKESLVVITMTDDTRTTTLSIRIMSEEGDTYEERLKEVLFHDFNIRECDLPFEDFYKKGGDIFNNLF